MSTKKRRIATYIPPEIEDKFQAFKQERGVGDSQALILVLTEFLGVSQKVAFSGNSLEELKSELLNELKSELSGETEKIEAKLDKEISRLKSELLNKPLSEAELKNAGKFSEQQELSVPVAEVTGLGAEEEGLSARKLSVILSFDRKILGAKAKSSTKEEFASFTKAKHPEGIAWEYREDEKYYPLPPSLSEGES
jgi:hypothetical protein